jgi:ribosomal protein S18 acetylase RimI-like enzyme
MTTQTPLIEDSDPTTLNALLDERLHAFNVLATGLDDGRPLHGSVEDSGAIVAAISGHTWGGCFEIVQLWVHEKWRGRGLGTALLQAAEAEARRRGCTQATVSSHSFQAPAFYEKYGYERVLEVADYPKGHAKLHYLKRFLT